MSRVLNMSYFWTFVNFPKYGRVLNMRHDAVMEGFWIFQDIPKKQSVEYAKIVYVSCST